MTFYIHNHHHPIFFVCVPPSRRFVLGTCLHILFFPIGVANGKAIWLQFLFYLCLSGKRNQANVKTMGLPCLEQCCALDNHRIIMIPFLASAPTAHSHLCVSVSLHLGNLVVGPHQIDLKKYIIPLNQLGFFQKERENSCKFMCYQSITHFREWRKFNLGKERNC